LRHREAERLGGFEIITNPYLVGVCTGQVRELLARKDPVDVAGCAPVLVNRIG
jgi:hypothetical protein